MTDEDVALTIKESWLKDMVDAYNKRSKLDKENDKLKTENKWYSEQLNEAVKENQQLKELLGDCKRRIEDAFYTSEGDKWLAKTTIEEIDNVIGGNKCMK